LADQSQIPEPTELIYVPAPSWAPAFTAVGLAALAIGAFAGWVISLVGAIVLARAAIYWYRDYVQQAERLPRRQRLTAAVIPPTRLKH
jgi:predicted hotdog family 3-hydroxylacyl-ACP dehydratase